MSANDVSEFIDVKDELAFSRSIYPKRCANWYLQLIKTDIKTAMKFQVSTGNESSKLKSSYIDSEDADRLGLWRKVAAPIGEKSKQLKKNVDQVSEAMDVLIRMKATKQ
ncbi:polyprotein [Frankliniella fusca]|uniref:Polyprotein n=1 Tax=Frankliniella fusca TaxID=407009 RepID=A0AAE1LTR8_9NEOP|nr:polyprotein [Frankliniella fusca]